MGISTVVQYSRMQGDGGYRFSDIDGIKELVNQHITEFVPEDISQMTTTLREEAKESALRGAIIKFLTQHLLVAQHVRTEKLVEVVIPNRAMTVFTNNDIESMKRYHGRTLEESTPTASLELGVTIAINNLISATGAAIADKENTGPVPKKIVQDNATMLAKLAWYTECFPKTKDDVASWQELKKTYKSDSKAIPRIIVASKERLEAFAASRRDQVKVNTIAAQGTDNVIYAIEALCVERQRQQQNRRTNGKELKHPQ